jgi:hypothetical protein
MLATLVATFSLALLVPMPAVPDSGRATVRAEVHDRLPGWTIQRVDPSWEGAYTVVTSCAGRRISFQFVPGHGLPPEAAWIHPSNGFARERLHAVSDRLSYLVWLPGRVRQPELSCDQELARIGEPPITARAGN